MTELLASYWWVVVLVLIVLMLVSQSSKAKAADSGRDPKRGFDVSQRAQCSTRAGGRCEYTVAGLWRCPLSGSHADHIVPHSRGGATSLANAAWTCQWHNLTKGARMPSTWFIHRLERRRRRYFPAGTDPLVNWRRQYH